MRIAFVADQHGNAVAFEAVIADLAREEFDEVICLGDVAQGGPQPVQVVDRLRELGWRSVFGNSDDFLLTLCFGREEVTRLVCCHATPTSNEDVILPDAPRDRVVEALGDADVVACGHVHLQWMRRVGRKLWLSVGSAGLVWEHKDPIDEQPFDPWAEYAVLTAVDGRFRVEFRRVPFDVQKLLDAYRTSGMPYAEQQAARWTSGY